MSFFFVFFFGGGGGGGEWGYIFIQFTKITHTHTHTQNITVSILYVRLASIKHDKTQKIIYLFLQIIHADLYVSALFPAPTFLLNNADTEK